MVNETPSVLPAIREGLKQAMGGVSVFEMLFGLAPGDSDESDDGVKMAETAIQIAKDIEWAIEVVKTLADALPADSGLKLAAQRWPRIAASYWAGAGESAAGSSGTGHFRFAVDLVRKACNRLQAGMTHDTFTLLADFDIHGDGSQPPATETQLKPPRITVADRMEIELKKDNMKAAWSVRDWAEYLGCGKSTVADAPIFKQIMQQSRDVAGRMPQPYGGTNRKPMHRSGD